MNANSPPSCQIQSQQRNFLLFDSSLFDYFLCGRATPEKEIAAFKKFSMAYRTILNAILLS